MRIAQVKKDVYEFRREIVIGGESARTGKIVAEKVIRYFEEKLRAKDSMIDKLKLKNSSLKVQVQKLDKSLGEKAEMGEVLHAIDFDQLDIETYVGLPLAIEGEGLFGTLCGIDPERSSVPLDTLEPFLLHIADLLTTALALDLERDRLQRRLDLAKVASRTDALTGLPNRRAFDLLLKLEEARCRRFGSSATILVMDLDGLKVRNDTEGHAAGDGYLRAAGAALSSVVRASDMAFRIGGDEFAVIAAPAPAVPETLVSRVNKALATGGVEASVGIATRRPDESLDDVLSRADERMYDLKRRRSTREGHSPAG